MDEPTKYYRTVFAYEVLSTDGGMGNAGLSLTDINYETMEGHASGQFLDGTHEEISREEMKKLLIKHGTDPNFLLYDDDEPTISIFVLEDGETWAGWGCEVMVTEEQHCKLIEGAKVRHLIPDWNEDNEN